MGEDPPPGLASLSHPPHQGEGTRCYSLFAIRFSQPFRPQNRPIEVMKSSRFLAGIGRSAGEIMRRVAQVVVACVLLAILPAARPAKQTGQQLPSAEQVILWIKSYRLNPEPAKLPV